MNESVMNCPRPAEASAPRESLGKRVISWLLAFLLAAALILFGVSFAFRGIAAPALAEGGSVVSDDVRAREMELIREKTTSLADLYGFSPEPVIACVDENLLRDLNRQSALWWKGLVTDGVPGEAPDWDTTRLEMTLYADEQMIARYGERQAEEVAAKACTEVIRTVNRVVLPMRTLAISAALEKIGKRIDLADLVRFLLQVPPAALAVSALLAGLIALLEGRRFSRCLRYIGAALGAAALVLVVLAILLSFSGFPGMIREASESLAVQLESLSSGLQIRQGLLVLALTAGCAGCLFLYRRGTTRGQSAKE